MTTLTENLKLGLSLGLLVTGIGVSLWFSVNGKESRSSADVDEGSAVAFRQVSNVQNSATSNGSPIKTNTATSLLSLKEIYSRSASGDSFEAPLLDEVSAFEKLLVESVRLNFASERLEERWKSLGWRVHFNREKEYVVIEESESQRRGRGLFAIRLTATDSVMIQAPHRFFDTGTGTITCKLFEDFPCKAAAWNSVHRNQFDIAHESRSFFNSFTRVLTADGTKLTNVQIHGFDASKRTGKSGQEAPRTLAIVSNATRYPTQQTKRFAQAMKATFGKEKVWLFPQETLALGATTNQQASVMRQQGSSSFLHVELSKPFRTRLIESEEARSQLYSVFLSGKEL